MTLEIEQKDIRYTLHHEIGLSVVPTIVDNFQKAFHLCPGLGSIQ